jgi:hypothetical protein
VREYVANLCADVADQFGVGLFRLEGVTPHTFDLDWLRPRALFAVPTLARTLLNLCFCKSCERQATAAGLDFQRLRGTVNGAIAEEIKDGPATTKNNDRTARLAADPEVRAYAMLNVRGSIDFVRAIRARANEVAPTRVSINTLVPYAALVGPDGVESLLEEYVQAADQLALHPGAVEANRRLAAIARRAATPRELSMLIARVQLRGGGKPPSPADPELLGKELQELAALKGDEITLYNYGILQEREPPAFVAAVRKVFPKAA